MKMYMPIKYLEDTIHTHLPNNNLQIKLMYLNNVEN